MPDQKHAELEQQNITFLRYKVKNDGDCLYASTLVAANQRIDKEAIGRLRANVALALPESLRNQGITDPETIEAMLGQSLEDYQKAIKGNLWGGEIEISILTQVLCAHVFIVSMSGLERYKYSGDDSNPSLYFIESTGTHFNALELIKHPGIDFLSESFDSEVPVTIVNPDSPSCESSGGSTECSQQSLVEEKRRPNNSPASHNDAFDFLDCSPSSSKVLFAESSDKNLSDYEEMDPESACGFPPRT